MAKQPWIPAVISWLVVLRLWGSKTSELLMVVELITENIHLSQVADISKLK